VSTSAPPGLSLGQPFGVPLRLSSSWFIGAAIITWILEPLVQRWLLLEPPWSWVVGITFAVLLGLSVLAHEMAHAVAAQRFGLQVRSMTIHLIGGVTAMEAETRRPWVDFVIAVVGPLTSLVLGGVAWAAYLASPEGTVFAFITWQLMVANLVVGVLNLVPALPLDGGRLLRDVVWALSGREHVGTLVAGWTGRGFAALLALLAVLPTLLGSTDVIWLAWGLLLAVFIWVEASRSLQAVAISRRLEGLTVERLVRPALLVPQQTPVEVALEQLARSGRSELVLTDEQGGPVGIVQRDAAAAVPADRRGQMPVSAAARSASPRSALSASLSGRDLIARLNASPQDQHLVVDTHGTVYGVLVTADVEAYLRST
jgi:Zn-dependent protease